MKLSHKVGKHIGHNQTVCNLFDILDSKLPIEVIKKSKEIINPIYKFDFNKTKDQTLVGALYIYSNDPNKNKLCNIDPCTSYYYDDSLYFVKNNTISLTEKYTSLCAYLADYKQEIYIDQANPIIQLEIHHEDKFNYFK